MENQHLVPQPVYRPEIFEVVSIEDAKRVIVTPEPGTTTPERWEKETPFLVEDIGKRLGIGPETCVLDYGCGVGRVAKGLIDRFGCRVVGVDFSPSMRLFAPEHVLSERFTAWSAGVLDQMIGKGFRADAAICIWVIQHVLEPAEVIGRIAAAIRPAGLLYALNSTRCVPTDRGWVNDGYDVPMGLRAVFREENRYLLPENVTTPQLASISVVQILRRPSD
jgi:SAM-dependent methyltransferase